MEDETGVRISDNTLETLLDIATLAKCFDSKRKVISSKNIPENCRELKTTLNVKFEKRSKKGRQEQNYYRIQLFRKQLIERTRAMLCNEVKTKMGNECNIFVSNFRTQEEVGRRRRQ